MPWRRAMRLIADGTVDRDGVTGLAARVGYTTRQLDRMLQAEVGAGPLALARAQRVQTARVLIETTDLPFGDIAFAAGFSSIRQFNDTVRAACDTTPTALRHKATRSATADLAPGGQALSLRLPVRTPFAYEGVFGHLAASAVPGCEEVRDGAYRRTLRLPSGNGVVSLTPHPDHVRCVLVLENVRDLATAIARCRRLLDLDADPEAVIDALERRPRSAGRGGQGARAAHPAHRRRAGAGDAGGTRPAGVDQGGQHPRRPTGQRLRQPVTDPAGGLTHTFPASANWPTSTRISWRCRPARRRTVTALVAALASGAVVLDPGCDWERAREQLLALPGIGPWTAEIVAMRGLGDPDAFPATDLGVRIAAEQLGLPSDARGADRT